MVSPTTARPQRRPADFWLRVQLVVALALPLAGFTAYAIRSYDDAVRDGAVRLERLTWVAKEHAERVFETNELLLRYMESRLEGLSDAEIAEAAPRLHAEWRSFGAELPYALSIWYWDARGRAIVSSRFAEIPPGALAGDREYFQRHAAGEPGPIIGRPYAGTIQSESFFTYSKRREVNGRFAGVMSVTLYTRYFTGLYEELARADAGVALSLVAPDGLLLARWPAADVGNVSIAGRSAMWPGISAGEMAGLTRGRSPIDGEERFLYFRRAGRFPVYLTAGLTRSVVLEPWRREMQAMASVGLPALLGLAILAAFALHGLGREREQIRQRREAEAALQKAQRLEAIGRLTSGVAHDFNNLLAVIQNNAHIVRLAGGGGTTPPPGLEAIFRAVKTGQNLTRQLLSFTRRQALRAEVICLRTVLPTLEPLLRSSLPGAIDLVVDVAPDASAIRVDRSELELALLNLLFNARDAIGERGRIRLAVANASDASPMVRIAVTDDGRGMTPAEAARATEPFFTTKDEQRGTGLGLTQVEALCVGAGGRLDIASTPGAGTTVTLVLPAVPEDAVSRPPELAKTAVRALPAGLRILLAEDNPDVRETTATLLRAAGADVTAVPSADSALDALGGATLFDVLLTDIAMAGALDGDQLARRARAAHPDMHVVVMTGFAHRAEALSADFPVFAKPVDVLALLAHLAREGARRRATSG
jgi:two-component system NtrC family sensor kinase